MISGRLAFAAALLCGALAASAQVREQITVEEVDVPVYVIHQGKPVRNLTRDDFELYMNGKRQPIDDFETVDFSAPAPAAGATAGKASAPHARLEERRLFVPARAGVARRRISNYVAHATCGAF